MLRHIFLVYGLIVICLSYPWGSFEMMDDFTLSLDSCYLSKDVASKCSCRKLCIEDSRCSSFGAKAHSNRWKCGLFNSSATLVPKVSIDGIIGRLIEMICPTPLKIIPNVGCIYLTTVLADWSTSRNICLNLSSDLWSDPNNNNALNMKNFFLQTVTGSNQYWTSAKQVVNDNKFFWNDGTVARKNDPNRWLGWSANNPNMGNNRDYCARLTPAKGYFAGDTDCLDNQLFAICEKKLLF